MKYEEPGGLNDSQLVALVLGKKEVDAECVDLAELIVLDGVISVGPLLERTQGTKTNAVNRIMRIQAAIELGRRTLTTKARRDVIKVQTSEDVVALLGPIYASLDKEHFYLLMLDVKYTLIHMDLVSIGNLNASIVHPRELFKKAIGFSAAAVIVSHNHPSGEATPSAADLKITERLIQAGGILGIEVLDHVIVGKRGDFFSLRDEGLMNISAQPNQGE